MIDQNKCGVWHPYVFKIFEIKFDSEKIPTKVFTVAYRKCDNKANPYDNWL